MMQHSAEATEIWHFPHFPKGRAEGLRGHLAVGGEKEEETRMSE